MNTGNRPETLSPSPTAQSLFDVMVDRDDVKREILSETLAAREEGQILESGRTFCSSPRQIRGPIKRFKTAVDLQRCPVGGGGAWHTHVTPSQIRTPTNSLPDISQVVFGALDVMAVAGTESAEYMLASADNEAMRLEFSDAIGENVESPTDVVSAIESGRVDPVTARHRVKQRLSGLFKTVPTGYSDLNVESEIPEDAALASAPYERVELSMAAEDVPYSDAMSTPRGANQMADAMGEKIEAAAKDGVPVDITGTALGAAIGTVVGTFVERVVFNE